MAGQKQGGGGDKHEKARDLAEQALDKMVGGDDAAADRLIEKAKKLDPSAAKEVVDELDEDAGSDPNAAKKAGR